MKKFIKWLLGAIFALAVIITFVYLWRRGQGDPLSYQIETARAGDTIRRHLVLTGSIVPRDEVAIKPQIAGIISEILVNPGDEVATGDIIARIAVVPEMMQSNNAEAQFAQTRVEHERIKAVHQRNQGLYDQGLISAEEYEKSKADYETSKLQLASTEDALLIIRKGVSARSSKESTTLVRATRSGKVLSVPVKVGSSVIQANNFNEGTTIATIANMSDLIFLGNADETEVGKLALGQSMEISLGALPNQKFEAEVEYISPQGKASQAATLFEVKGAMKNLNSELIALFRSGYSANAKITTSRADNVITIPESCLSYRGDSTFVQIVTQENPLQTEERFVEIGLSDGQKAEVKQGIKVGERVRGNQIIQ